MTVTAPPSIKGTIPEEDLVSTAILEYFKQLSDIVDVHQARFLQDDPDFHYEAKVPHERLYEVTEQLADLSFRIHDKYGVKINTLAVPV